MKKAITCCLILMLMFQLFACATANQQVHQFSQVDMIKRYLGNRAGFDIRLTGHGRVAVWALDADAREVLLAYEKTTGRRIVLDKSVKGFITAYYEGTDFYAGLDAILRQSGLNYEELNEIIFVFQDRMIVNRSRKNTWKLSQITS